MSFLEDDFFGDLLKQWRFTNVSESLIYYYFYSSFGPKFDAYRIVDVDEEEGTEEAAEEQHGAAEDDDDVFEQLNDEVVQDREFEADGHAELNDNGNGLEDEVNNGDIREPVQKRPRLATRSSDLDCVVWLQSPWQRGSEEAQVDAQT